MIITILVNVVFVVSLIIISFYFVTANIYDMTLMDKAFMSLLMGVLPALVNISFKNFIATVIALLISVTALILIAFTKFFEKEHEKELLYDCLLDDISHDLKKFRHMSRNEQIAFLKSVITTVESTEKEESTDENGNKVITTKTVIQKVPLIENDEELAEYEPILRKEIKL